MMMMVVMFMFRPSLGPRMRATERVYPRGGGAEPPGGVARRRLPDTTDRGNHPFPSEISLGKRQFG